MKNAKQTAYRGIYDDVANTVGTEKIKDFFNHFRGQQIEFPMKLYSKEYVIEQAIQSKGKKSLKEVAIEYGYSERYLRKLLQQYSQDIGRNH